MARKQVKIPVRSEEEHSAQETSQSQAQAPAEHAPVTETQTTAEATATPATQEGEPTPEEKIAALEVELQRLREELTQVRGEVEMYKDQYLRAMAEMDNLRKRLEKRYADEARQEKQRFLQTILPFVDHLEMVIKHSDSDPKILHQGVQMIFQELMRTLEREGVKPIESVGQKFDPFVHEAVEVVETEEVPPDTVVDEVQRGYTYQGALLRPARVRVARPAPTQSAQDATTSSEE